MIDAHETTSDQLVRGNWTIDIRINNQSLAGELSPYHLLFDASGSMVCTKEHEPVPGTWNLARDNNAEVLTMELHTTTPILNLLNQSWIVTERNTNGILFRSALANDSTQLRIRNQH